MYKYLQIILLLMIVFVPSYNFADGLVSSTINSLYFIPNKGQFDPEVEYSVKTKDYHLWITRNQLVFDKIYSRQMGDDGERIKDSDRDVLENLSALPGKIKNSRYVTRLQFLETSQDSHIQPENQRDYRVNYFLEYAESRWITGVPTYESIIIKNLYQNIDLKIYGESNKIEYDFIVKPGGKTENIKFLFEGARQTWINKDGDIIFTTDPGELLHSKPFCYVLDNGEISVLEAVFKKTGKNIFGLKIERTDPGNILIIDPVIMTGSSYLGGSGDELQGAIHSYKSCIAVDSSDNVYIAGSTDSPDFPTSGSFQPALGGERDFFVTKMSPDLSAVIYSTYLGEMPWIIVRQ